MVGEMVQWITTAAAKSHDLSSRDDTQVEEERLLITWALCASCQVHTDMS